MYTIRYTKKGGVLSFFQFIVYELQVRGSRLTTIAQALEISVAYLGMLLRGERPLSAPVKRKAAALFRVQQVTLDQKLAVRDVQRLALHLARARKVVTSG